MTPRAGLLVAFIGLVIAAACAILLFFVADPDPASDDGIVEIIVLNLTGLLGLTVFVLGLTIAVVTALRGKPRRPL